MASLVCISGITSIIPKERDPVFTQYIFQHTLWLRRRRVTKLSATLSRLYCKLTDNEAYLIAQQRLLMNLELHWSRGRSLGLRPADVSVEVQGIERVKEALARGKGVLLWRMSLTGAPAVNSVFFKLGLPVTHLSTPNHLCGSEGWFARNVAGPLFSHDEARYLSNRVIMESGRITGYLDTLGNALTANKVVTIVGDANRGRIKEVVEIGKLKYAIPSGAPALARATGATLLPCAAVRVGPFEYRLVIFDDATPSGNPDRRNFRLKAIEKYAHNRQELVTRYPASDMFL